MRPKRAFGSYEKIVSIFITVGLLFMSVFMIILPAMSNYYVQTDFSIHSLTHDVLSSRIINAPECLAHEDNGIVHAGLINIDSDHFTSSRIRKCIADDFQITIYGINTDMTLAQLETIGDYGEDNADEFMKDAITQKFLVRYCEQDCTMIQHGILEVSL